MINKNIKIFRRKKGKEVLKIKCPSQTCNQSILVLCPFCHKEGLEPLEHEYMLVCPNCHQSCKELVCSCGTSLKASVIEEKQREFQVVREKSDPRQFVMVILLAFLFALVIGVIVKLQYPLYNIVWIA
ncbi:MAG: hypothetical protein K0S74_985 [Chlamydiales bacterium]|jgi:hypothetical protein|nr:hypothetical protein [Chlamydiales bacterium]